MSTATQVCDIVLPGYTLVDRIGSGGYADVWRAEAPGGIQKAVKVVHGYCDDEFASQELKALERVKGVRHPFLLSLERFEVVSGRLAILTELADMSLDQRRRQCCEEGLSGIPRDELLRYMADTAEALDFLSQRHNLLHLDIKPENLLILGDHIKVADFGLVKELASRTQNSLVSGLTPTYASPEMFDDEPSAQSDQYSLAIVYQQMLVGTLPFPGRTAAQLAKQHTQAEPQLMSLPAEDRPVIARALAKKPTDRFPSCRAFVDALMRRVEHSPPAAPIEIPMPRPAAPAPVVPDPNDTKSPSFGTTIRRSEVHAPAPPDAPIVTQPVRRAEPSAPIQHAEPAADEVLPIDTVDVALPDANPDLRREQPTLYVAIGGVGVQVLSRLRALVKPRNPAPDANDAIEAIALDTDREELRQACSTRWKRPLAPEDTLHIPLRLPKSYDNSREILGWLSRRWLYNIPRSLETRGYRPLGRIALVDHAQRVLALTDRKLERLAKLVGSSDAAGQPRDDTIKIVLLAGTGGGTGAGVAIDVANILRTQAARRNVQVEINGLFICPCLASTNSAPLPAANTYALLTELNHATAHGNAGSGEGSRERPPFESQGAPFDHVYFVPTRARTGDGQDVDPLDTVARYLACEAIPDARAAIRSCRGAQRPGESSRGRGFTLKKFGHASLADRRHEFINELAVELAAAVKAYWVRLDRSQDWQELILAEQKAAKVPKLARPAGDPAAPVTVLPANDATPLALRGRFKENLSLQFTSDAVEQIQRRLESRDERGRPLIIARDAKMIADAAAAAVAEIVRRAPNEAGADSRFSGSSVLQSLISNASQRVLKHAIETIDLKQPQRFLAADVLDQLIEAQCQTLLEASLDQSDVGGALKAMVNVDQMISRTIEQGSNELLHCSCERRTLLLVPKAEANGRAAEAVRGSRPLAAVVPADVDDVAVVTEYAGIAPRSLALAITRVYPGIADAAHRLLTRIDIDWKPLV
ncbi:MAG TPA: tubulin-like doman-containing protein [Lacipirellulaceae bacterium]